MINYQMPTVCQAPKKCSISISPINCQNTSIMWMFSILQISALHCTIWAVHSQRQWPLQQGRWVDTWKTTVATLACWSLNFPWERHKYLTYLSHYILVCISSVLSYYLYYHKSYSGCLDTASLSVSIGPWEVFILF